MDKKEAFSIVEEMLKMLVNPSNHFQEEIKEYICNRLDIADNTLSDVLDLISKESYDTNYYDGALPCSPK